MRLERVQVTNHRAFGEKVKAWAKGTDPLPRDISELAEQLAAAQVGATIPKSIKAVKFVECDEETFVVKLPPKRLIEESEARLAGTEGNYPMPAFYERVFQAKPSVADKLGFHAERIGDYTIGSCM